MPIYEYRCRECGQEFEQFVRSSSAGNDPTCPHCESQNVGKSISVFGFSSASQTEAAICSPNSS